jgi:protein phosphatase
MQSVIFSKKGTKSDKNEDACLSLPTRGLFVVADGVGGGPEGDFASRSVVNTIYESAISGSLSCELIKSSIDRANMLIYSISQERDLKGMASTVVACWKSDDQIFLFNVGDSRGYRLRGNAIQQLTKDHTRQVQKAPNVIKQVVTNAVGIRPSVDVDVTAYDLDDGDVLLLMSDGISDELDDEAMLAILTSSQLSLAEKARALVDESERRGGRDDKSVILALNA